MSGMVVSRTFGCSFVRFLQETDKDIVAMPAIKVTFPISQWGSEASFDGTIEPSGATGYAFSGTLTATCPLKRAGAGFDNAVRLGHGGTSGEYTYVEQKLGNAEGRSQSFSVKEEGVRAFNETVDFCLGFNEGLRGEFHYADKVVSDAGGPSQKVLAFYTVQDSFGKISYDVRFNGTARADGPKNYSVEGTLDAYLMSGALTNQYVTIGHKSSSGSWHYQSYSEKDMPVNMKVFGARKVGENIVVVVGTTSKVANLWGYGNSVTVEVPDLF